jgi:hypothetical protein
MFWLELYDPLCEPECSEREPDDSDHSEIALADRELCAFEL